MISDYIKKIELRMKRDKFDKKKMEEKYWKLPATERIHFDSLMGRIPSFDPITVIIEWVKWCVFVPLFFIIAGYIAGKSLVIIPLARDIMVGLFGMTKYVGIIILVWSFWNIWKKDRKKKELWKRFNLRK